jgi:hypothetical protein
MGGLVLVDEFCQNSCLLVFNFGYLIPHNGKRRLWAVGYSFGNLGLWRRGI